MSNLEYNIKIWEKKKRKAQFQIVAAGIIFIGLLTGIALNLTTILSTSASFPYIQVGFLAGVVLIFFCISLSSWTNYSFLYHYFMSQWIYSKQPDQLELLTGTLIDVDRIQMPYVGSFKRIQVRLKDEETVTLYVKPEVLNKVQDIKPAEILRIRSFHMFAVEVNR